MNIYLLLWSSPSEVGLQEMDEHFNIHMTAFCCIDFLVHFVYCDICTWLNDCTYWSELILVCATFPPKNIVLNKMIKFNVLFPTAFLFIAWVVFLLVDGLIVQVGAALRPAFAPDTSSDVTAAACEVCPWKQCMWMLLEGTFQLVMILPECSFVAA